MDDYISRQAFVAEMKSRQDEAQKWLQEAKDRETAIRADTVLSFLSEVKLTLDKIPSADVRQVVLCKDCKHNPEKTWFECPIGHKKIQPTAWCFMGERDNG